MRVYQKFVLEPTGFTNCDYTTSREGRYFHFTLLVLVLLFPI